MHIEIQMALNFVISYLYNKLPRRRVNLFGEELEKALKDRFQGHWYPEKPFKGSAFRCLKTGEPTDAVLDRAARESGVPIADILENLPAELAVWVDPGEVSYRIGEKGAVKILYSEMSNGHDDSCADREVTKTFNPEAPCFRPIDAVSSSMQAMSLSPKRSPHGSPPSANGGAGLLMGGLSPNGNAGFIQQQQLQQQQMVQSHQHQLQHHSQQQQQQQHHSQQQQQQHPNHHQQLQQQQQHPPQHGHHHQHHHGNGKSSAGSHNNGGGNGPNGGQLVQGGGTGVNGGNGASIAVPNGGKQQLATSPAAVGTATFLPRSQAPLTFTTATFAQTKFGSTKLKTSSKRANSNMLTALSIPRNRVSPTEFSNYIKQRALQQHQLGNGGGGHHGHPNANHNGAGNVGHVGSHINHLGPIGSVSPARSISPNPLAAAAALAAATAVHSPDPFYFGGGGGGQQTTNAGLSPMSLYSTPTYVARNMFDATGSANGFDGGLYTGVGNSKYQATSPIGGGMGAATSTASAATPAIGNFLEPHSYYGLNGLAGLAQNVLNGNGANGAIGGVAGSNNSTNIAAGNGGNVAAGLLNSALANSGALGAVGSLASALPMPIGTNSSSAGGVAGLPNGGSTGIQSSSSGDSSPASSTGSGSSASAAADGAKLLDGLNSFYTSSGPYQHLLVAN